jgi:hypothetical protein
MRTLGWAHPFRTTALDGASAGHVLAATGHGHAHGTLISDTGKATSRANVWNQTGEDDDHLAVDDSGGERTGWLRSGDGPLSVRARPSSIKRDCDRRTMSTGRTCLADVHAKSRLILETSADTPVRRRGPGGACPDRTRAIPCKVTRASRVIRILHDTTQT